MVCTYFSQYYRINCSKITNKDLLQIHFAASNTVRDGKPDTIYEIEVKSSLKEIKPKIIKLYINYNFIVLSLFLYLFYQLSFLLSPINN